MKKLLSLIVTLSILATMLVVPSVSVSAATAAQTTNAVRDAVAANSTLVFEDTFAAYADKVGTTDATLDATSGSVVENYYATRVDEGRVVSVVANPDDTTGTDISLQHNQTTSAKGSGTQYINRAVGQDYNSDYMVVSVRKKIPASYYRMMIFLRYKDSEGNVSDEDKAGLRYIIKADTISNEMASSQLGTAENVTFTKGKYAGKWVEYTTIIDTKNNNARTYIDGDYLFTMSVIRNSAASDDEDGDGVKEGVSSAYTICGIEEIRFGADWSAGSVGAAYYDDIAVRTMSAEQYTAFELDMLQNVPEAVKTGTTLPATTDLTGSTIEWSCSEEAVTITDGVVTVPQSFYGDVTLTATVGSTSKDFTVKAGLEPVYVSIEPGTDAHKVIGDIKFAGNHYSGTVSGYRINNPIYHDGTTYRSFIHESDNAHNLLPVTDASGVTKVAAFSTGFDRNGATSGSTASGRLRVETGESFTTDYTDIWVEIEYLDSFSGDVKLLYNAADNTTVEISGGTAYATEAGGKSGNWVTRRFNLTNANFAITSTTTKGEMDLQNMKTVSKVTVYSASAADENGVPKPEYIGAASTLPLTLYDITNDGTGKLSVKKEVTVSEACTVQVFLAIYDSVGDLKSVTASSEATFTADELTKTITADVTSKAFDPWDGDTIKLFVWDADDLTPIQ